MKSDIARLKRRLMELQHIVHALGVLHWDLEIMMPPQGAKRRAETIGYLSLLAHEKVLALDDGGVLSGLKRQLNKKQLTPQEAVIVAETWRAYDRERKIPASLVQELSQVTSEAAVVWRAAKSKAKFSLFKPYLEKIVTLKRKEAECVGYTHSPYDALLDVYEPGMTAPEAAMILNDLKDFLVPFVAQIQRAKKQPTRHTKTARSKQFPRPRVPRTPRGPFPVPQQQEINRRIAEAMGFSFDAGVMYESTHPFTTGFHPYDVRFTTRYHTDSLTPALFATIHEAGHALYEQGLSEEHFGTPLAESISLGIHESQSRLWENIIGRSLPFWRHFYPKLVAAFPAALRRYPLTEFYRHINWVTPSLIRIEADEVTYNLHIIIRFEIEKELIEGSIEVADLPAVWRDKVKSYLGLRVPHDGVGVLQDIHWSGGSIGYFPTYTFGNLYAAQFYNTARKQIKNFDRNLEQGKLLPLREWLRKNIHVHGKFYSAGGLVREVTGEELTSRYFVEYLKSKHGALYGLA